MSSSPSPRRARPLSPHLQIYRPQITSAMSIVHRVTGVGLTLGLPVLVWWLWAVAKGPETYEWATACFTSNLGLACLFGWSWAFLYHLCAGIRHLLWDAGWFVHNAGVDVTGRLALGASTILTVLIWVVVL